ncbi:hypothetical protein [Candidatus Mycolicibacterium alkanivorans]|uniref:Uncharacterized protein n=1 Tax=Candidatus Mycolicibacterium alkanivorans TaxID=2954114 RepID=A0ABS9YRB9_9MYCO|nr:hypothetical protein [Candidatus Mycolicibacterium alkanivorans]MCI4673780.1 hypothetical protein [Candidatus Mycolicibacterium alkanivorans]
MSGGQLNANADQYLQANGMNVPPPPITSDPLVAGAVPIEQLLRVLGLAANLGDPKDNSESLEEHARRDAKTAEAAAKFPAQDEDASAEMKGVAGQGEASQMAQELPQMASGIAGALAGAMGGALQPLTQIPQQVAQGAQQAMQAGMGMMQQAGGSAAQLDKASLSELPLDEYGADIGELGAGGGGEAGLGSGGGGGLGGTAPTAMLGPPPVPSAGTSPSSAPVMATPPPAAPAPSSTPAGGMSGMPMVPPGAMHGAGGSEKDAKADTKRVSVPTVKNGAPVQGRITTPPPAPPQIVKKVDGEPVATKRIIVPNSSD